MSRLLLTPAELIAEAAEKIRPQIEAETKPHRIDPWRGATQADVEHTLQAVEFCFDAFARNVTALLDNLNTNLPLNVLPVSIALFQDTLADLRSDVTSDIRGAGDHVNGT